MNKKEFIEVLAKEIGYNIEKTTIINEILEKNFFISRSSKGKIIEELKSQLAISEIEAESIYQTSIAIINEEIKRKIKHPFKSKD